MNILKDLENLIEKRKNAPQKTNLLFLDFDGVINIPYKSNKNLSEKEYYDIYKKANRSCMENLNIFCKSLNLNIVVSSSWRVNGLDFCKKYLYDSGLDTSIKVVGITQNFTFNPRYLDIYDYLINNYFTNFIILDDLDMNILNEYSIKTSYTEGFNDEMLKISLKRFAKI